MTSVAGRRNRRNPARDRRRAQLLGALGLIAAVGLPVYLWHDVVADLLEVSEVDAVLVAGFAPWILMLLGLLCVVPVMVEHLRVRDRRFYRPGTGAWWGWAISLYLLGFGLGTQVAQIHSLNG